MKEQPNVVFFMCDQMAAAVTPWDGRGQAIMPHLEELAKESVIFDQAYCNSPLCASARYVLMSGRLPTNCGAYDNSSEFSSEIPTFAHYLRGAGYRTALSGKMHFIGPDQLHGFEERLTTDVYPSDFTWTPNWREPEKKLDWFHNMDDVLEAGTCYRSNQLDYDDEVVFNAKRYLFDHARAKQKQPFCLVVSLIHPHDPYITLRKYWNQYEGVEINLPDVPHDPDNEDPHSARLRRIYGADEVELTDEQIRTTRRAYYGSSTYVDDMFGQIKTAVEECGFADDTIFVFTTDHGDMLGERGLWYKSTYYDYASRIPLMIHAPSRFTPKRVDRAVSHVDILPTLVELANPGKKPIHFTPIDGRSLVPDLEGDGVLDEVIGEYFGEGVSTPLFMILRNGYKFIGSAEYPSQLFNLKDDPKELNNLAQSDEHQDLLASFQAEMVQRWDSEALREEALEGQDRRLGIAEILKIGKMTPWDYQAGRDASEDYIRNTMGLWEIEARSRFPKGNV